MPENAAAAGPGAAPQPASGVAAEVSIAGWLVVMLTCAPVPHASRPRAEQRAPIPIPW